MCHLPNLSVLSILVYGRLLKILKAACCVPPSPPEKDLSMKVGSIDIINVLYSTTLPSVFAGEVSGKPLMISFENQAAAIRYRAQILKIGDHSWWPLSFYRMFMR